MDPTGPPPTRPGAGGGTPADLGASETPASYPDTELSPTTTTTNTSIVTPGSEHDPTPTISTSSQHCILGGVHHSASEEDIPIYGKPVHVHGSLSKHPPTHVPVHHDPHGIVNYAKAAKEEIHEMHEHPKGTGVGAVLLPGGKSGVEMWDKVRIENSVVLVILIVIDYTINGYIGF